MKEQDKIKQIKEWYKEGKIKRWGENSFLITSEAFALGITPRLVSEVLKEEK